MIWSPTKGSRIGACPLNLVMSLLILLLNWCIDYIYFKSHCATYFLLTKGVLHWSGIANPEDPLLAKIRSDRGYNYTGFNTCDDHQKNIII